VKATVEIDDYGTKIHLDEGPNATNTIYFAKAHDVR
jgi:hypothetical protein